MIIMMIMMMVMMMMMIIITITTLFYKGKRVTVSPNAVTNLLPLSSFIVEFGSAGSCGDRKSGQPREKPTAKSTQMRRRVRESKPGHRGWRRALIHCANLATLRISTTFS